MIDRDLITMKTKHVDGKLTVTAVTELGAEQTFQVPDPEFLETYQEHAEERVYMMIGNRVYEDVRNLIHDLCIAINDLAQQSPNANFDEIQKLLRRADEMTENRMLRLEPKES